MKMSENFIENIKLLINVLFVLALVSLFAAGCGSGGGSAGGSAGGGTISGSLTSSSGVTARLADSVSSFAALEEISGVPVQLVDAEGVVVQETVTDINGRFEFTGVEQGDYTVRVLKDATGDLLTEVDVSLLEGDDAFIEGAVAGKNADWSVYFVANETDLLQNDAQMRIANNIAQNSGVSLDEVITLRESGLGWGEIAHQLDVPPGSMGLGHDKGFEKEKHTEAFEGEDDSPNGNGNGKDNDHGKSGDDHGKSDDDHGKSDDDHGKSDDDHGKGNDK